MMARQALGMLHVLIFCLVISGTVITLSGKRERFALLSVELLCKYYASSLFTLYNASFCEYDIFQGWRKTVMQNCFQIIVVFGK